MLMKSAEVIGWALGGLEREISTTRERLSSLTEQAAALRSRLGRKGATTTGGTATTSETGGPRKRRRRAMSPEARKRISDNMKKRWADRKKKGQNKL